MPTGLIAAIYLARRLGPEGYGLFALAVAVTSPLEWVATAPFAPRTARAAATAQRWRAIGVAVWPQLLLAASLAIFLAALSPEIAVLVSVPSLAPLLRLFALDIPVFTLAHVCRDILTGRGLDTPRALSNVGRMVARPALIILLVERGLGAGGAILGTIGVSVIHLLGGAIAAWLARPRRGTARAAAVSTQATARALAGLGMRLFERVDLLSLAALGTAMLGRDAAIGSYGVAQFLTLLPGLIAAAFMPQLEGTLRAHLRVGEMAAARALVRGALRAVLLAWPWAALAAGAAPGLVVMLFGPAYAEAATPLALLCVAAAGNLILVVAIPLLLARGQTQVALALALSLPAVALVGQVALVPRLGGAGAALVTAGGAAVGAAIALDAVAHAWRARPPGVSMLRCAAIGASSFVAARLWAVPAVWLSVQLVVLGAGIVVAGVCSGELRREVETIVRRLAAERAR